MTIAQTHLSDQVEHLAFDVPMAVDRGPAQAAYDEMAELLAPKLAAGRTLAIYARATPLFYGSAMYLLHRLPDAQIEIIPRHYIVDRRRRTNQAPFGGAQRAA